MVTITTVGYGDYYPVSTTGRFVALALMIGGIGLIGFVTGSLASWIVERISETTAEAAADRPRAADQHAAGLDDGADDAGVPATRADIAALMAEVAALRTEVSALRSGSGSGLDSGSGSGSGAGAGSGIAAASPADRPAGAGSAPSARTVLD